MSEGWCGWSRPSPDHTILAGEAISERMLDLQVDMAALSMRHQWCRLHAVRLPVIRIAAHSHDFGWSQEVNSFRNSESLFSVESEWMVCSHHIAGLNLTARVAVM